MQLLALTKKEFLEALHNYKLIIVPIVFILLAALQPITFYYLPDIMKLATFSEGAIIQIPIPTPAETIYTIYGQLTQVGLIIIILISMGAISNEIKSGVAETILIKPIRRSSYLLSKWALYFTLTIISFSFGVLVGKYYTTALIGESEWLPLIQSSGVMILYLLIFVAINLLLSTILKSSIAAGGITILLTIIFSLIASFSLKFWFLPSYLLTVSQAKLLGQSLANTGLSIAFAILLIVFCFITSVYLLKRKQL